MNESKLKQLKQFVDIFKSDPSVLSDISFSLFFRDYIESLGGKPPASAYSESNSSVDDESNEEGEKTYTKPHVEEVEEEEQEELVESNVELEGFEVIVSRKCRIRA